MCALRVVHLADYGGSYPGSFVPMLLAVFRAAQERGWTGEAVFEPSARGREWVTTLESAGLTVRFSPPLRARGELNRWLAELVAEQDRPTVLHTHFTSFDLPAVRAAWRRARTAVVWHVHSRLKEDPATRVRNVLKLAVAARGVARILCVTPEIRDAARRRLAPRRRLVFMPNAIDAERFPLATEEERRSARRELELPADRPVLMHFGWAWERKAGPLFLETVAELDRRGRRISAVTVGGGEAASSGAASLGVDSIVRVVPPTDDVRTLYAAADVMVTPSVAEGMPFAVLEALATGTPVVASEIPGHALLARDIAACTLAPASASGLANSVERVLERPPAEREALGAAAHAHIRRHLDLRAWAQRVVDVYGDAVAAS